MQETIARPQVEAGEKNEKNAEPAKEFLPPHRRLHRASWIILLAVLAFVLFAFPAIMERMEAFNPGPSYRVPRELSNDFWVYRRWAKVAAAKYPVLVVGDSAVWGEYVLQDKTLSSALNSKQGREVFANCGLEGSHPVSLAGLVRYHARAVRGKHVLLQFNPLWMSSAEKDLTAQVAAQTKKKDVDTLKVSQEKQDDPDEKQPQLNQPALLPQFYPRISAYQAPFADRVGVEVERYVLFFCWLSHARSMYLDKKNLSMWAIDNPYGNPLKKVTLAVPQFADELTKDPDNAWWFYSEELQDFPWVQPAQSLQWTSFLQVINTLEARGNSVFVIIGPMNVHMLTPESRGRYETMKAEVVRQLQARNTKVFIPSNLTTDEFGDASHPLGTGYERMADELSRDAAFVAWVKEAGN